MEYLKFYFLVLDLKKIKLLTYRRNINESW